MLNAPSAKPPRRRAGPRPPCSSKQHHFRGLDDRHHRLSPPQVQLLGRAPRDDRRDLLTVAKPHHDLAEHAASPDRDDGAPKLVARAQSFEHAPAPAVSSAGALVDALHGLGARRIGIVAPYLEELTRLVVAYIEDAGIEVKDAVSLEVSDNRAVAALDPEELKSHWRRLDLGDCDALVLSACVQMPSLSVLEEVEQRSGLPTLSAATATTWAVLRALDLEPVVPGGGALLRSGSTTVSSTT